ncbi:MAG: AgmX/PglI C-terminal domain-containing protein [Proteobacteria bacterium]|nr:AgmX/PglI C-terminal domain-containing protein [Pseudomonadota bacterium]
MLWLACADAPPAPEVEAPIEEVRVVEEAPPAGTIGGEPILARPVVLGGISTQDVETVVKQLDWMACHRAGMGKVLVQFTLSASGSVAKSETVSSSLRNPETETCLNELLLGASFPALERGEKAIVKYTFSY